MKSKLAAWLELLFSIRVGPQVICVREPRGHPDLREARTKTKSFEIWRLSKSLVVYPEGYRLVPAEEFEGLDGTIPDLAVEYDAREVGQTMFEWLRHNSGSRIVILHDGDPYWQTVCGHASAESTASWTVQELGLIFNLETGERHDQSVEWPHRLRDFLENLNPQQEAKLADFVAKGGLGE